MDNTKSQSNKKQTIVVTHKASVTANLTKTRLYNCTKWMDKEKTIKWSVCLMRAILNEATDSRLPKIQNESTVSASCLHHNHPHSYQKLPASQAHLTQTQKANGSVYLLGILQAESTEWWHALWATVWACFSCRSTPTQSVLCTNYFVYITL